MAVIGFIFVPKVLAERGGGNGGLDARDSNFGTSLRDSMRDSKAFQRTNSVSLDRTSSNAAVNDTVAQIRQAAMECSKTLKSYDDVEKSMSNGDGNTDEKGIQSVEVGKDN
jgi:hypothetical protein